MKSAVELAMERANAALGGEEVSLTEEQKAAIDEVRKTYEAKWAEQEIAFNARLAELRANTEPQALAEARSEAQREMASVREKLFAERDAKIEAIRRKK